MIRFLIKYWWVFPIVSIICSFLIILSLNHDLWGLADVFTIMALLLLITQLITFIFCFSEKKWGRGIGSVIAGVISFLVYSYATFVILAFASSQPSSFGKEHPIPENLEYNIPLKYKELNNCDTCKLIIWNGFQGGIYEYSFYYPELPDGKIYLRCYEFTENIALSASKIKTESTVEVKNHNKTGLIADRQRFKISEGDWGDYYVARIEVWFKNANTREETKLTEKIYRVEGWSR